MVLGKQIRSITFLHVCQIESGRVLEELLSYTALRWIFLHRLKRCGCVFNEVEPSSLYSQPPFFRTLFFFALLVPLQDGIPTLHELLLQGVTLQKPRRVCGVAWWFGFGLQMKRPAVSWSPNETKVSSYA